MKHTKLILSAAALLLSAFAADAYGAARHILAAGTDARSRGLAGQTPAADAADTVAFDTSAPILSQGDGKLYYIRKINLHGVKYLNHDILKSSAGLEEGDSIYLPSKFISNAIQRLWAPKYFSDVQIGATIEGDSLDLEVFLKERPRILRWQFDGVGKGKQKDLIEELKLRRNTELSDYVIDKNTRLIKSHFSKKGSMSTARSFTTGRLRRGSSVSTPSGATAATRVRQVQRGRPFTVMPQEPHMPTRQANR